MKNLIYQVAVGPKKDLYEICIDSVSKYCSKYGIEHIVQREPVLKIVPKKSHRSSEAISRLGYLPIYEKENAFDLLGSYDNICIVDSDIYIKHNAPNIFDQIEDYDFAGVLERDMPLTKQYAEKIKNYSKAQYESLQKESVFNWNKLGADFYNMGLMLCSHKLKNYLDNQTALEFIQRPEFERFVNGEGQWRWSTDQTLLNYWIKKYNIRTKNLDWKWNALYRGIKDEHLPEAHFVHFFLSVHIPKDRKIADIIKDVCK